MCPAVGRSPERQRLSTMMRHLSIVGDTDNMANSSLATDRTALLDHFRQIAASAPALKDLQQGIVEAIAQHLAHYNWTGFYMLDPDDSETLVLGPFVGAPTDHVRIPVSQEHLQSRRRLRRNGHRR